MRRYTQLEMEILKEAGYSVKEIARMDKAGATGYCVIWPANFCDYVHLSGEYVTYSGNRYFVEWVG